MSDLLPCPSCRTENVHLHGDKETISWVVCYDCFMAGPLVPAHNHPGIDIAAEAIRLWNALSRGIAPWSATVGGVVYTAHFSSHGNVTSVHLYWAKPAGGLAGVAGASRCHPGDVFDQVVGMRLAMRKACGIGDWSALTHLRPVYDAFRQQFPVRSRQAAIPVL